MSACTVRCYGCDWTTTVTGMEAAQYERILRDLIEEIKEEFIELPDGATESCVHPCVYRAEARLREVTDE